MSWYKWLGICICFIYISLYLWRNHRMIKLEVIRLLLLRMRPDLYPYAPEYSDITLWNIFYHPSLEEVIRDCVRKKRYMSILKQ